MQQFINEKLKQEKTITFSLNPSSRKLAESRCWCNQVLWEIHWNLKGNEYFYEQVEKKSRTKKFQ